MEGAGDRQPEWCQTSSPGSMIVLGTGSDPALPPHRIYQRGTGRVDRSAARRGPRFDRRLVWILKHLSHSHTRARSTVSNPTRLLQDIEHDLIEVEPGNIHDPGRKKSRQR